MRNTIMILAGAMLFSTSVNAQQSADDFLQEGTASPEARLQKLAEQQQTGTTTITCYQNGKQIIHEANLTNYRPGQKLLYGKRPDGTWVTITGVSENSATVCKVYDKPHQ
jgi:hypothetical protein